VSNNNYNLKCKDKLYYARIIPTVGIYEVCEIMLRTVRDDWFVGIEKRDKHAFLFSYNDINNVLFENRRDALEKVKEAEKNKKPINEETYYEEN